jgi:ferredoxin-thioredoxin reductase catalytic subunit
MTERQTILNSMQKNATENGYFLCPDAQLLNDLIDGLATNTNRHGYGSCPCRVSCGSKKYDVDIICPCEYRDADIDEFGMCYCGLFVSKQIKEDPSQMGPIPERRPREVQDAAFSAIETKQQTPVKSKTIPVQSTTTVAAIPVWRCSVCGYLCAREIPPPICPICKAKSERFEPFTLS